jgi:hypothetical protein
MLLVEVCRTLCPASKIAQKIPKFLVVKNSPSQKSPDFRCILIRRVLRSTPYFEYSGVLRSTGVQYSGVLGVLRRTPDGSSKTVPLNFRFNILIFFYYVLQNPSCCHIALVKIFVHAGVTAAGMLRIGLW